MRVHIKHALWARDADISRNSAPFSMASSCKEHFFPVSLCCIKDCKYPKLLTWLKLQISPFGIWLVDKMGAIFYIVGILVVNENCDGWDVILKLLSNWKESSKVKTWYYSVYSLNNSIICKRQMPPTYILCLLVKKQKFSSWCIVGKQVFLSSYWACFCYCTNGGIEIWCTGVGLQIASNF